ncbi:MAG: TIGR02647 family protein [Alcanivoracaceae bacterium]|nr:TIGR02647 family protein [Alcanivoracaceae bacterium]
MRFTTNSLEELNLLLQFHVATTSNGIKVHSTTRPEVITACQSLFDKGLIDQADGGYLTDAGIEALGHAQSLCGLLAERE